MFRIRYTTIKSYISDSVIKEEEKRTVILINLNRFFFFYKNILINVSVCYLVLSRWWEFITFAATALGVFVGEKRTDSNPCRTRETSLGRL